MYQSRPYHTDEQCILVQIILLSDLMRFIMNTCEYVELSVWLPCRGVGSIVNSSVIPTIVNRYVQIQTVLTDLSPLRSAWEVISVQLS